MTRDEFLTAVAELHTKWALKHGDDVPYVVADENPHPGQQTDLAIWQADRSAPAELDDPFNAALLDLLEQRSDQRRRAGHERVRAGRGTPMTNAKVLTAADTDPLHPQQPPVGPDDLGPIPLLWQQAVNDDLIPLVAEIYTASADTVHVGLVNASGATVPAVSSLAAEEYLATARNTFDGIGTLLWENARNEMLDGLQAGESIPQIAARVRAAAQLTAPQATMVARTQVLDATNAGSYATAQISGLDLLKGWEATPDARTRPTHVVAGTMYQGVGMIPLEDQFSVGGWPCERPHDPQLPSGERANCRCTLVYEMAPQPGTPGEVRDAQHAATVAHEQRLAELRRVFDEQRAALAAERDRRVAGAGGDRDAGLRARAEHAARLAVLRREFEARRVELRAAYEARLVRLHRRTVRA